MCAEKYRREEKMGVFIDEDGFETELDNLDDTAVYDVKIKVIGVGGGGCNAL